MLKENTDITLVMLRNLIKREKESVQSISMLELLPLKFIKEYCKKL